jgi:Ca2+-binding EF-hand superfamily protein
VLLDHDGTITAAELGDLMRALGRPLTESQLRDVINSVDLNHDSTIDFDEFVSLMTTRVADGYDEVKEAFLEFDKDKNGFIDKNELRQVMKNLGMSLIIRVEEYLSTLRDDRSGIERRSGRRDDEASRS